jgi:hypothetical protein
VILPFEPEQPAQFAFRIVEASGANVWYSAIVASQATEAIAAEIARVANGIQSDSAVVERVVSAETFERAVHGSTCRIWIGTGFECFDESAWSRLDRDRTRLERAPAQTDSTIVVLVMSAESYGKLQSSAPNLASWIGGSVFHVAPELLLSSDARAARLNELRLWGSMSDADVVRSATEGTLPADPYFAEWLVLLDRGDLLGDS